MPRMPKKKKAELAFFLNDRGRIAYNGFAGNARILAGRASGLSLWTAPVTCQNEPIRRRNPAEWNLNL